MPYEFYLTDDGIIAQREEKDGTDREKEKFIISDHLRIARDVLVQSPSDIYMHDLKSQSEEESHLKHTKGMNVPPGGFGIGRFLISDGFGPCIFVLAKLLEGESGLYHASDPHANIMACKEFLTQIKGKVTNIYIFKKCKLGIISSKSNMKNELSCYTQNYRMQ